MEIHAHCHLTYDCLYKHVPTCDLLHRGIILSRYTTSMMVKISTSAQLLCSNVQITALLQRVDLSGGCAAEQRLAPTKNKSVRLKTIYFL